MLSRLHLIPERHGQTDGRTDRRTELRNIARQCAGNKTGQMPVRPCVRPCGVNIFKPYKHFADATQLDVELSTRSQRVQLSPINERSDPVDSVCRS